MYHFLETYFQSYCPFHLLQIHFELPPPKPPSICSAKINAGIAFPSASSSVLIVFWATMLHLFIYEDMETEFTDSAGIGKFHSFCHASSIWFITPPNTFCHYHNFIYAIIYISGLFVCRLLELPKHKNIQVDIYGLLYQMRQTLNILAALRISRSLRTHKKGRINNSISLKTEPLSHRCEVRGG